MTTPFKAILAAGLLTLSGLGVYAYHHYKPLAVNNVPRASLTVFVKSPRIRPADIYPPAWAPGESNPDITQENIAATICNPNWSTSSIRPPSSYTTSLKIKQLRQLGYADQKTADYEEDHIISLELGGAPTSTRNLFPEPYTVSIPDGGARFKDKVENYLHDEVCAQRISLAVAQQQIAWDWYKVYVEAFKQEKPVNATSK